MHYTRHYEELVHKCKDGKANLSNIEELYELALEETIARIKIEMFDLKDIDWKDVEYNIGEDYDIIDGCNVCPYEELRIYLLRLWLLSLEGQQLPNKEKSYIPSDCLEFLKQKNIIKKANDLFMNVRIDINCIKFITNEP